MGNKATSNKRPVFFSKTGLKTGFTLVELIVVISILAILATIAFLSFQGYSKSARDSARITDMKSIQQGLAIQKVKSGTYPQPEGDTLEVIVGTETLIQGYIKDNISNIIRINKTPLDPKDSKNYIYTVDRDRTKAQLMGYLENGETIKLTSYNKLNLTNEVNPINQTYAEDTNTGVYQDRSPYTIGDKLGILLDENKLPLQETTTNTGIDLSSTDTTGFVAYFGGDTYGEGISTGTGDTLITQIVGAITNTIPCNPTSYSGYTITALSHNQTDTFTKPITIANGTSSGSLTIQCINGTLDTLNAIETTTINCNTNYVLDNQICQQDICTGSAPEFSIANGTQKYNIPWLHSTTPKDCSYICQAGYYYNNSNLCIPASIGNIVPTEGLSAQTPCSDNNTFQDTTGQTTCKTVQSGYYSTPIGTNPHTGESQCEANSYCTAGVKTACPVNYSSLAGSTSLSSCILNSYYVSGSFGTNANGANITGCGKSTTADANGNFSFANVNYGSACNNITATKLNYTCTTTTNGPASLMNNITNISGSCSANTQSVTCGGTIPVNSTVSTPATYIQTRNGSIWTPTTSWGASQTTCDFNCNTGYIWSGTSCINNKFPGEDGIIGTSDDCDTNIIILANGQVWSACNLGAKTAFNGTNAGTYNPSGSTTRGGDDNVNGKLYQWGRNKGFTSNDTSYLSTSLTTNPNGNDIYNFVCNFSLTNYDWLNPQQNTIWGGSTSDSSTVDGQTNDTLRKGPCPTGWHIPSVKEFQDACTSINGGNFCANGIANTSMRTTLLLSYAGYRDRGSGLYKFHITNGYFWSSSPSSNFGYFLNINSANVRPMNASSRALGLSVRCIKD